MKKKKKSFISILFNTIVIILFIGLIASVSLVGFLYFKYDVNFFACVEQINKLNGKVDTTNLITNGYTETDYESINSKIEDAKTSDKPLLKFTDRELCAYLNKNINQVENLSLGDIILDVNDCKIEVLQIKFTEIDLEQPSEHYCNMNVVVKLNISSLKNDIMHGFPISLFKKIINDELYISADCSIDEVDGKYQINPLGISINNLDNKNTKSFLATINKFYQFSTAEKINQSISSAFTDALLGTNGIYKQLQDNGATGYGWQQDNNFIVYFVDINQKYSIIYNDSHGVSNDNISEYTIRNNIITLHDLVDNGYQFLGWYMNIDGEDVKVETIDSVTLKQYTLESKWKIIQYTITCDLRGGKINENTEYTKNYTIEDDTFDLPTTATKEINNTKTLNFAGWLGEDITTITNVVTIEHGSYGNKHYAAYYEGEEITLTMVVDGITIGTESVETGKMLSLNELNTFTQNKLSGYTINDWYTNAELTNQYNYSNQLVENKTIYATSKYINDCVYFYPYLAEFNHATKYNNVINITSREMLIAYIDYCVFYDIRENNDARLTLKYMGNNGQEIVDEISYAANKRNHLTRFERSYSAGIKFDGYHAYYYITESDFDTFGKNHFNGSEYAPNVYTQQDYVFRADNLSNRSESYNDFELNYVGKTLPVFNSEQLVWALENGYKPVCQPESDAEKIYSQAKQVLRNICTDDMTDIEKLQAIYKWLALNVNYDQEAYKKFKSYSDISKASEMARTYDSWYAEGVFNYGKAVCEGYAKSLLILAKLEGIPTVRVSGDGHMWNKVYLDGVWYGIDATHGDMGYNNQYEIFTNTAFLFTDEYKETQGYTATNYPEFEAITVFNIYDEIEFTYNHQTYDLFIDNQSELNALINYIGSYITDVDCSFYTIEIASNFIDKDISQWIQGTGWSIIKFSHPLTNSSENNVYTLYHNK